MKHITLSLATALLVAAPLFAARRVLPLVGHAPGANSTFWTSDLQVTNASAASRRLHLTFHPNGHDPVSRDIDLAGHESKLIEDVVAPRAFGLSDDTAWIGELEIESPDDFSANARTFTRASSADGTFGSVSDSIDPSILADHGTVTGVAVDDRYRSNASFTNPSDDPIRVHIDLRRREGSIAFSDDIPVEAHRTVQIPVRRSDDSMMSMQWSSNRGAYVVVSTIDNRSGDPSESRSMGAAPDSAFFPLVGKTQGANGTFWTTSLSLTNMEDRSGDATIEYQGNDSQHVTRTVTLPARGSFHQDDVFQFLGLSNASGLLSVQSSVGISSSARVFNTREDGGTYGSMLLPQDRASRSSLVRVRGVRRSDDYRLNVAIADDNDDDADGTVRLFDDRGAEIESQRFHIPRHSAGQLAMSQTRVAIAAGQIEVETEHGVEVSVIASNVDNRSGDTVVAETEQENERQQELEIRMSANTAAVGTPITFTAIVPPGATNLRWDFGDGSSATGASVTHAFAGGGEFKVMLMVTLGGATLRTAEDVKITGTPAGGATGFDFTWSPSSPQAGQSVTFTAVVNGNVPAGAIVKWQIEGVRSTGATATHTFASNGSFQVEAELEQEGLGTLHAAHVVTVGGVTPPPPGNGTVSIDFTWSPSSPAAGQLVTFTATVTGSPAAGSSIKWRMPDGSRPGGTTATFTFAAAGNYSVEVEIEQPGQPAIQRQHSVAVH